jgi:hypothetical protein
MMDNDEPGDDKVVSLVELADEVIDAAIPELEKDIAAAGDQTFRIQLRRVLTELRTGTWPPIDGQAAGALHIGLDDVGRARLPAVYQAARARLRECLAIDEAREWSGKAAALMTYARIAKDPELLRLAERVRFACGPAHGRAAARDRGGKAGEKAEFGTVAGT